jgi:hypothetical protein
MTNYYLSEYISYHKNNLSNQAESFVTPFKNSYRVTGYNSLFQWNWNWDGREAVIAREVSSDVRKPVKATAFRQSAVQSSISLTTSNTPRVDATLSFPFGPASLTSCVFAFLFVFRVVHSLIITIEWSQCAQHSYKPNVIVVRLTLRFLFREVTDSNLGLETKYSDWSFSWLYLVSPDKCWDSTTP